MSMSKRKAVTIIGVLGLYYFAVTQLVKFYQFVDNGSSGKQIRKPSNVSDILKERVRKLMDFNPDPNHEPDFDHLLEGCQYKCEQTHNVKEADVVMFSAERMQGLNLPDKRPGQIWMLYTREPPTHRPHTGLLQHNLKNKFNWTKTVLRESTFPIRYGRIFKTSAYSRKNYGHCTTQSRREEYVTRVAAEVDVHIYGNCGNYTCGSAGYSQGGEKDKCLEMLSDQYKFYLSFENALCRDYMTEKVYNIYTRNINVIPVVRGGASYDDQLPYGTFINAADFRTPKQLGKFLKSLANDKDRYIAMLKKKDMYIGVGCCPFYCKLCEAAHTQSPYNVYNNISEWYSAGRNCKKPTDFVTSDDVGKWARNRYNPMTHPSSLTIPDLEF